MTSFLDLLPLVRRSLEDIRAQLDSDANEGVLPGDSEYVDTTPGGWYWDVTQAASLEIERLWDFTSTEVIAACLLPYAFGDYLDDWGDALGVERKDAVKATGKVSFTGATNTVIPLATHVAVPGTAPDADPIMFETTAAAAIAQLDDPLTAPTVDVYPTSGYLSVDTYSYCITAVVGPGETLPSPSVDAVVTSSAGRVSLSWAEVEGAALYRVYRGQAAGAEVLLTEVDEPTFLDDGSLVVPGDSRPTDNTTGAAFAVPVQALETGSAYNASVGSVSLLMSAAPGVASVTNEGRIGGGADVEDDEPYRDRLLLKYQGSTGAGTVADYKRMALAYPGVGYATVVPVWNGPGTVRVIVTDANNDPVSSAIVNGLQALLDPVPGMGAGEAAIGHTVVVATPVSVEVTVAATVALLDGYALDGAGGAISVRESIEAALRSYIGGLASGETVLVNRTEAAFFEVPGIYNVSQVTLNGAAGDAVMGALEVPVLGTVTLD